MTTVPQYTAAAFIAAGLVLGGSTVAHATDSPYVTVAWSYPGYPDMAVPQPFLASTPGANLHAFDSLAASPEWCGKPIQVDVYQRTDKHGVSWTSLKEKDGQLHYGTDGGYLAYNAGVGTPYRVITPKEIPCTTPSPTPTSSPSSPPESSVPIPTPSASSTPEPSGTPTSAPSASAPSTPTPSASSVPAPTSPSSTKPPTPSATTTPTSPSSATSTGSPSTAPAAPSSSSATPMARTAGSDELAHTGTNPWPGLSAAALLLTAGITLLIARARKAAKR